VGENIHRHIEHRAGDDPHQLALRLLDLVVQAPQNALTAAALVVLNEGFFHAGGGKKVGLPGLEEVAAAVAQHLGFDHQNVGNGCSGDVQDVPSSMRNR
jgi:predicted hotdog family 3-hydroxylacyl-ACP dehydratase